MVEGEDPSKVCYGHSPQHYLRPQAFASLIGFSLALISAQALNPNKKPISH